MRRMKFALPVALAGAFAVSGCTAHGPKETGGALLGAVGGAVAGAQFGSGRRTVDNDSGRHAGRGVSRPGGGQVA